MSEQQQHSLLLLLGKGQKVLTNWDDTGYRVAEYELAESPGQTVRTPFVGEALVRLSPHRFTRVYVFGTAESMWDVLLAHCLQHTALHEDRFWIETYEKLRSKIASGTLEPAAEELQWVGRALSELLGRKACCYLIPVGQNREEIWGIFRTLMRLNLPAGRVSIDITHGLRHQPLFLYLALLYYQALSRSLSIDGVYYGALELTQNGRTPIFNLREFLEMTQWILAVYSFVNYGDAQPVLELLPKEISSEALERLKETAGKFTSSLQTNLLGTVQEDSQQLLNAYADAETDPLFPRPLRFLKKEFLDLPMALADKDVPKWEAMLRVARYHWEHSRPGLSILALWEAVVERLGERWGWNPNRSKTYQQISERIAKAYPSPKLPEPWRQFLEQVQQLRKMRNVVAHAEGRYVQVDDVMQQYPAILRACEELLGRDQVGTIFGGENS